MYVADDVNVQKRLETWSKLHDTKPDSVPDSISVLYAFAAVICFFFSTICNRALDTLPDSIIRRSSINFLT